MTQRPFFQSLRGKITNRVLLISLVPMLLTGALAWLSLNQLTADIRTKLEEGRALLLERGVGASLIPTSRQLTAELDVFMLERISDVIAWASTPTVREAAKAAAIVHKRQGLTKLRIKDVEAKFRQAKSLNIATQADRYLQSQVTKSGHVGEIFFTDIYGFNVALTNPTSDFVQRDEDWWQVAMKNGISVGKVKYDDSAKLWSIDISVRIDDSSGRRLGVIKTVFNVALIQKIADLKVKNIEGGEVIVVTHDGLLLADTRSEHDPNDAGTRELQKVQDADIQAALQNENDGYILGDQHVIGYAHSAGAEFYQKVANQFSGFNWVVIVKQPMDITLAPLAGLTNIESALAESRNKIFYVLAIVIAVVLLVAVVMASLLAKGMTVPLLELSAHADAITKGDLSGKIEITSNDEIGDLAGALDRLVTSLSIIIRRYKTLRNKMESGE